MGKLFSKSKEEKNKRADNLFLFSVIKMEKDTLAHIHTNTREREKKTACI